MTYLKENFIKLITGSFAQNMQGVTKNAVYSSLGPLLNEWNVQLKSQNAKYDALVQAFSNDSELICDRLVESGMIDLDDDSDGYAFMAEISSDTGELLHDGFIAAATNCGYDVSSGMTMTSTAGEVFNIFVSNVTCELDGITNAISTNAHVTDPRQLVVFEKNGHWYFNNVVYTYDFWTTTETDIYDDMSINTLLMNLCAMNDVPIRGTLYDSMHALCSKLNVLPASPTIKNMSQALCANRSIQSSDVIITNLIAVIKDMATYVPSTAQHFTSWWTLMSNIMESSAINDIIQKTINALIHAKDKSVAINGIISDFIQSKYQNVKNVASNIRDAFTSGGFVGVVKFLSNFANAQVNMRGNDGLLSFTDNSALVPQVYTAGLVSLLVQGATALASVIATIVNKVAGIIVSTLGAIINSLVNVFNSDYNETYASANVSENVLYDMCPVAYLQTEFSLFGDYKEKIVASGLFFGIFQVPGGYIVYGPGEYGDDGYPSIIRYEFHPMTTSYVSWIKAYNDQFIQSSNFSVLSGQSSGSLYSVWYWISTSEDDVERLIGSLCDIYTNQQPDKVFMNDTSGYIIDDDDDLIESIHCNVGAFYWFMYLYVNQGGELPIGGMKETSTSGNILYGTADQLLLWFDRFSNLTQSIAFGSATCKIGNHFFLNDLFTWTELINCMDPSSLSVAVEHVMFPLSISSNVLLNDVFIGTVAEIPANLAYAINWPKYDRRSFITSCVIAGLITVAVVAVAVGLTISTKKAITKRRATNQVKVERAWDNFKNDPTSQNYALFRKSARKNNFFATFFGGTKYSYNNYWETSSSGDSESRRISSGLLSTYTNSSGDIAVNDSDPLMIDDLYFKVTGTRL